MGKYWIMTVECFPFLRLNWWTVDYPRHQFDLLGLVSALGSHLVSDQDAIMGRVPMWGDECLKHSYYTRVGFSFSRLFYSNFIVFVARLLN